MRKAAPNAFRKIESDITSGAMNGVRAVLLCGDEGYLVDHYEHRLREMFVSPVADALDLERVYWSANAAEESVSKTIAGLDTFPMMSEKRIVLVSVSSGDEKTLSFTAAKSLAEHIALIHDRALLIFTSASVPKNSALYKAFAEHGKVYDFERLQRDDLSAFVRRRFKANGVSAPAEVVSEVIKISGYLDRNPSSDLFALASDISSIASYARGGGEDDGETKGETKGDGSCVMVASHAHGGSGEAGGAKSVADKSGESEGGVVAVTLADVAICMGASMETDVFAMLDAVSAGRKGDAIELVANITGRGESGFGLLALLTAQFEIMLGYLELRDSGKSMGEMMKALGVSSEYRLKKAAGFAKGYKPDRLSRLLSRLYRVERDIRSGIYDESLALTMFVAEM